MKTIINIAAFLFFICNGIAQSITRGPELGELYFMAPTHTDYGLYYSTDFGQTALCVDSINTMWSIAADKTPGGVYYFTQPFALFYSDNYGYNNTWIFRNSDVSMNNVSGVSSGQIFSSCSRYSENYGINFTYTTCNGCFGNAKVTMIDNTDENIGYVITTKLTVADTNYLFISNDKFENTELIHRLEYHWSEILDLARGYNSGEVFMFNFTRNNLWFTNNYFDTFHHVDTFNIQNFGITGIEGDNGDGELYLLYGYTVYMEDIRHAYIFHSQDYGQTFDVYHPFALGPQPFMANFSTLNKEPQASTAIEFDNFSIGDIEEYQWDFENDGIIDSYDEYPVHIYDDTGYYSVSLTIMGGDSINTFVKENYIHVIDTVSSITHLETSQNVSIFPNPFTDEVTIQLGIENANTILIYNS